MSKWASVGLLRGGLNFFKSDITALVLVKAYTPGDSLATINSNKIAEVALTSDDLTIAAAGANQKITSATKTASASAGSASGDDLHFVFHDGTDPHYATDETTDQVITPGNPVQFPALTYTSNQPT